MNTGEKQEPEYLSGTIERITYHNPENGFAVLRTKVRGHKDLVTIIGNIPAISVGEYVQCKGIWCNDYNHGLQFKADFLKNMPPNSLYGIERYLGSGLIKGIGPHFAKKLVSNFGEDVFEIIEAKPELLSTVEGIGKVRANSICKNWQEQKIVREIMIFLQSHGVGTTRATRIYKTYGNDAIQIVSENPYRLAKDIRGIGFLSSDMIAKNIGIETDSLIRARAGINHILFEATSDGHCGLPIEELIARTVKLLEIDRSIIEHALDQELEAGDIVKDKLSGSNNISDTIFLGSYYFYEKNIATMLLELKEEKLPWSDIDTEKALPWVESELEIKLADNQQSALITALKTKVMVITGGPGTGKTTLVNSILNVLAKKNISIKLCAPTGRAAKRLSETTNMEAITIHRLLEFDPRNVGFKHNDQNPINCDYLVIDESSMVDVPLFYSLIRALPKTAALLLVGDVDQLPSVGAGAVLSDIIASGVIPTVKLNKIFRQAACSNIITNAHLVNQGKMPVLTYSSNQSVKAGHEPNDKLSDNKTINLQTKPISDFYFVPVNDMEELPQKLIHLVKDRIPKRFGFNSIDDIQVLCPMQRGGSGARSLNVELQKALNPDYESGFSKFGQVFAVGDKVMQLENNYDKETYNGDIGIIQKLNDEEQEATIRFYDRDVVYDYTDFDQITLAYATTIHKSQGSEYKAVIIPLTMQSYIMLQKNLLYTAITRGKKLVVIVGQKKAIGLAVLNNKGLMRYTKLKEWLEE